jgi:hypothetical protein
MGRKAFFAVPPNICSFGYGKRPIPYPDNEGKPSQPTVIIFSLKFKRELPRTGPGKASNRDLSPCTIPNEVLSSVITFILFN